MRKYWQALIAFALVILLNVIASPSVHSQEDTTTGDKIDGFPVLLADETLFVIQANVGSFSSEERAQTITNRIQRVAEDESIDLNLLRLAEQDVTTSIFIDKKILVTLTEADAKAAQISRTELANEHLAKIQDSLQTYRQERSAKYLIRAIIYSVIATVLLILVQFILNKIFPRIYSLLDSWRESRIPSIRIQNVELVRSSLLTVVLKRLVKLIHWSVILFVLYLYFPFVFSFFPWTKALGKNLFSYLFAAFEQVFQGFINYLPNLFVIAVIILFTYYIIRFVKLIFGELQRGEIAFPGFYQEWAAPTYKLSFFLILALAVVIAFPYLPGSGSPAFQGVSLFLGLLLSLGSTAAVANIVGGVILIYTRAFEVGDRVQIGDAVGDIVAKTLLVTRLRTPKNMVITMPNSTVLSSNVVNFSATVRDPETPPLILHTTITLGYDVPWRKVHQVLTDAAIATEHILSDPAPFILQTSLDDFYVSYELNAYTNRPLIMSNIYSQLHQHLQDKCNEADIEILSPHYSALRDGHQITIPANYLPNDYNAPGFRMAPPDKPDNS
ncbi:small-conductance mechanosensitive channel [Xenococcus sp. PCC 7305]|uniref:mechanosensitive ion channel family protein n=1 Tax=Xenococcus sp. PCC 7305 TaxID=102125 RepID=UPI0002AC9FD5|nr:mechanosensitive ion channel domain-containing protein [Xenococcus sp. PCC 7305]ELS00859.1 small-conductance mechanosensitive channel [Xenococcus sp. PCC 7305]